ncbi:hypothetical protein [Actinacidiphila yeochonensis]|uniref:hypothetical protein n=1 Tax=Actinacidiphila yeochonensis TaxID=89050 RepID=UPI0012FE9F19|nr:hypothetical protein [Actinacidiphila yeochonensis]
MTSKATSAPGSGGRPVRSGRAAARLQAAGTALTAVLAAVGCGSGANHPGTLAEFTAGGVKAVVEVSRSGGHEVRITATLRPRQAGFHLYSLSLPDGGVDGLGIPTRLSVAAPLVATGPVTSDDAAHGLRVPALDVTLPVYPDGPVTLRLPARVTGSPTTARLSLSYGACSASRGCLMPVRDHALTVRLPV